ncbi:CLUMA_CG009310, isoform A [Clunio marinus]|uniref:CLUMA_CG009310, isoform A n=1 Tax=Clunio marinus TaxID=568069 RepID=A0A1J1I6B5_9DIPT|nr:CLUMA_CG009310, isoform A [Clunio marinus]
MTTVDERSQYLNNRFWKGHIYENFTYFYVTIAICAFFGLFLFGLNLICGLCSKHKHYWNDRFTGNRWIVSLWTATAHKQPPLDLSELENVKIDYPKAYPGEIERVIYEPERPQKLKRGFGPPDFREFEYTSVSHKSARETPQPEVFIELHKRESEI